MRTICADDTGFLLNSIDLFIDIAVPFLNIPFDICVSAAIGDETNVYYNPIYFYIEALRIFPRPSEVTHAQHQ